MIFKNIYNSIKKDKIFTILIVIQLSITFLFINLVTNNILNMKNDMSDMISTQNEEVNYRLVDTLYEDPETQNKVFNDKIYFSKFKLFYEDLSKSNDIYTFYENIDQQLYIKDFSGQDKFYEEYKYSENVHEYGDVIVNGDKLSGINNKILSKNIIEKYNFNVISGRMLNNDDFILNNVNATIPVLVGYEFKDEYNIGDKFEADLYYKRLQFEVIGILEKDTYINKAESDDIEYLDTYIITPSINYSLDVSVDNEEDYSYLNILYLQKTNGVIGIKKGYKISDFINKFDNLTLQHDVCNYEINGIQSFNMKFLNLSSKESIKIVTLICLIMILFSIISISFILLCKFIKNKYNYGVHILLGSTKFNIVLEIILEIILLCSVSNLIALGMTFVLSKGILNYSNINFLVSIIIVIVGCIIPIIEIRNSDISSMIGDKN
ncbi:MAG: hypothetical protein ACRCXT_20615 [Paraclostridium sp.]